MKTRCFLWKVSILFCFSGVPNVYAQDLKVNITGGLGGSFIINDVSEPHINTEDRIGFRFQGGLELINTANIGLFIEGGYFKRNGKTLAVDLPNSTVNFHGGVLIMGGSTPVVYGLAGIGIVQAETTGYRTGLFGNRYREDGWESGLSVTAGAGVRIPFADRIMVFVEGRYQHGFISESYQVIPITAGLIYRIV